MVLPRGAQRECAGLAAAPRLSVRPPVRSLADTSQCSRPDAPCSRQHRRGRGIAYEGRWRTGEFRRFAKHAAGQRPHRVVLPPQSPRGNLWCHQLRQLDGTRHDGFGIHSAAHAVRPGGRLAEQPRPQASRHLPTRGWCRCRHLQGRLPRRAHRLHLCQLRQIQGLAP